MRLRMSDYVASCSGKPQFTERTARGVAARTKHRGEMCGAYRCRWCGCWHVGAHSRKTIAAIKADNRRAALMAAIPEE